MQEQIERDLKTALLSGDRQKAETLKNLKNALQYEAVALRLKTQDLKDEQINIVFAREAKKRQEAAELYKSAGETEREDKELQEKAIIDSYLPTQMSEEELEKIIAEEVKKITQPQTSNMGKIIGAVKARTGSTADGSTIARLVKLRLESAPRD